MQDVVYTCSLKSDCFLYSIFGVFINIFYFSTVFFFGGVFATLASSFNDKAFYNVNERTPVFCAKISLTAQ